MYAYYDLSLSLSLYIYIYIYISLSICTCQSFSANPNQSINLWIHPFCFGFSANLYKSINMIFKVVFFYIFRTCFVFIYYLIEFLIYFFSHYFPFDIIWYTFTKGSSEKFSIQPILMYFFPSKSSMSCYWFFFPERLKKRVLWTKEGMIMRKWWNLIPS